MKQRWKGTYIEAGEFGEGDISKLLLLKGQEGLTKGQKSETKLAGIGFVCAMVWHRAMGGGGGAGAGSDGGTGSGVLSLAMVMVVVEVEVVVLVVPLLLLLLLWLWWVVVVAATVDIDQRAEPLQTWCLWLHLATLVGWFKTQVTCKNMSEWLPAAVVVVALTVAPTATPPVPVP